MKIFDFEEVKCRNPVTRSDVITLRFSQDFDSLNGKIVRYTPAFHAWAHVSGKLPPINNIENIVCGKQDQLLTTLESAVACFKGIKRPHNDEKNGESVFIFVVKPKYSLEHVVSLKCIARLVEIPENIVITVLVVLNKSLQPEGEAVDGLIVKIEPVFSSIEEPDLPLDWKNRYGERIW